ncbi:MFS transporter [Nakamurella deserti]|uniref:MFS transporter n=1 Tax=Nakamurella deserti TaxID=2164074 RepID=UPI001300A97E|nr:MFS transporter [Nakamurella deserti]
MTTFLSAYKALPAVAGRALLPVGFLARLPQPMLQLGMVLLVTTSTGSLGYAGLAAGALSLGAAVGGPWVGRLADRRGQRVVMVVASLLNAAFAVAFVVEVALDAPRWLALVTAAATGAATPQIGPLMRSRWVRLLRDRDRLSTAMSWEGAADEIVYILGPVVVSLFTLISPSLAMLAGALMVAVFGVWAGLHPSAAAAGPTATHTVHAPVWREPAVASLLLVSLAIGSFFGGMQTAVTAVATLSGAAASAGLLYAAMGVGSALTGLGTSALPARFGLGDRLVTFTLWLVVAVVPLLWITAVPLVAVLLFVVGCGVGPALITVYSLAERQVSPERTGVTMTLISAGSVIGYSIGSSLGGRLAQDDGPGAAFTVSLAAVGVATVVAVARRWRGSAVREARRDPALR